MARPQKQTVDYFPHYVNQGKTLLILENEFHNDGYVFWFKLLELLCKSDGQFYDYNNSAAWRLLLAETRVPEDMGTEILKVLADIDAIDSDLYKGKIIWVQKLVDNLDLVYTRREKGKPQKPIIPSIITNRNPQNVSNKPHTKQNNTKQNNTLSSEISKSLTELLKTLILENNPIARVPENPDKWILEIDRMIRIDKRPPEIIEKVIRWCQTDSFWKTNILSAESLRDKFDQLLMKMKSTGGTYHGTNAAYKKQPEGASEAPHALDGDAEAPEG